VYKHVTTQACRPVCKSRPTCSSVAERRTAQNRLLRHKVNLTVIAKPKFQHRQYQSPTLDTILSQFHPPPILTTRLSEVHFNVIDLFTSPSGHCERMFSKRLSPSFWIHSSSSHHSHVPAQRSFLEFTILVLTVYLVLLTIGKFLLSF
jgi:hypothetical protein